MRTYSSLWRTTVVLAALLALVVGGASIGWFVVVGTSATLAALGALAGFTWVEGEGRWRATWAAGAWFGGFAVLLLGLPSVIGGWALVVLLLFGAGCPLVVQAAMGLGRTRRTVPVPDVPERMPERELERRWRWTTQELRRPGLAPTVALMLVQERQGILDELERRDPDEFAARLVRSGWRSAGSSRSDASTADG